jgi:hypothetical protein
MTSGSGRLFRLRMLPGRTLFKHNGDHRSQWSAGEEIVLPEAEAASLVRHRTAEIIEVIEPDMSEQPPDRSE